MTERQGRRKAKTAKATVPAATPEPVLAVDDVETTPVAGDAAGPLALASFCTLREAVAMKGQLLERLDQAGDVEIDAGSVEKIDTAGLQLLVAFSRQLRESHRALAWKAVAPEMTRAAAQIGLADTLGLPADEGAP
jgi:anti-anti-sigma regulatory factor